MNADLLYAVLMSVGWAFLVGWLALLVIACGLAFRSENPVQSARPHFADGYPSDRGNKVSWKVHLRN
jgi:hypothetical protein